MFIVGLIPLTKGTQLDTLTYFSSIAYPLGTVLLIPMRNRTARGVVTHIEEASTARTALRAATFSLKKIPEQVHAQALSPAYLRSAEVVARHSVAGLGAVLYAMLPPEVRSGVLPPPRTHHVEHPEQHSPEVLQGTADERHRAYRSLVRETFAHSGSVHLVAPTSADAEALCATLSAGIEDRTILFSGTQTVRALRTAFEALEDFTRPKLIISTASYPIFERHDITTVIVEHARSPHFSMRTRPYIDHRETIRIYAKETGRRLIFGDLLPRSEEEQRRRDGVYTTYDETPKRLALQGKLDVIEMKREPNAQNVFSLFSPELIEAITATRKKKGRIFLFSARRGLSPVVACVDCGHIFRSPQSGAPYSLIRMKRGGVEERWFVCGVSGMRERAADTCPACGSWRLRERGIGIQAVYDELSRTLKGAPIIIFDHLSANTAKRATFLSNKFYKTKGAIILGTHMALPYLTAPIDMTAIVNVDALYSTPTWRLQEENLALLLRLRELTKETMYVQTRGRADELIEHARRGSVEQFYTEELELRKTYNYPPFTTFIHLTWQGESALVNEIHTRIAETLQGYPVNFYSAAPTPTEQEIRYGLIRIASKDWPDEKLLAALRSLPPSVRIMVNPDRIV